MKAPMYLALALLGLTFSQLQAQSSVWTITKNKHRLYITGTAHVLRSKDLPLPKEFELALQDAEIVFFETDNEILQNSIEAVNLMNKYWIDPKQNLETLISTTSYGLLQEFSQKNGFNLNLFKLYKPAPLIALMTVTSAISHGFNAGSVDLTIYQKARELQKKISYFESPEFQFKLFTRFPEDELNAFIIQSLEEMDQIVPHLNTLLDCWSSGDAKALEKQLNESVATYPKTWRILGPDRNLNWMKILAPLLDTPETEAVFVGFAHLIGKDRPTSII